MIRRTVLSLSLVTCFLCLRSPLHAQEATPSALPETPAGLDMTISPPVLNLVTEPGASVSAEIKLKNNSNTQTEALRIDLMKFVANETGDKPQLMELSATDRFPQWLDFSEPTFTVEPQTWKTIKVTFSPPENADPAYYFTIVFTRQSEPKPKEGEQPTHGAIAVLGLTRVNSSRVYHQLDLAQLSGGKGVSFTSDHKIYEFLPANFTTTITNNGNVHELVFGNIFIDRLLGGKKEIDLLTVNSENSFILPQSTRQFKNSWANGFPHWEDQKDDSGNPILDKNGKVRRKLVWDLAKIPTFRIGKYRATLILAYNDGIRDIPLEAQTEFWVIPWRILLGLLVVIILIIIGLKGTTQSLLTKVKSARNPKHATYITPDQTK